MMVDLLIKRVSFSDYGVFGVLIHELIPFALTLERPWLNNQSNISCIPEGTYICKRSFYGPPFNGDRFEITGVPGRTGILIHRGVFDTDSKGCILVGEEFAIIDGRPAIASSDRAFNEFMGKVKDENIFRLTIKNV